MQPHEKTELRPALVEGFLLSSLHFWDQSTEMPPRSLLPNFERAHKLLVLGSGFFTMGVKYSRNKTWQLEKQVFFVYLQQYTLTMKCKTNIYVAFHLGYTMK